MPKHLHEKLANNASRASGAKQMSRENKIKRVSEMSAAEKALADAQRALWFKKVAADFDGYRSL